VTAYDSSLEEIKERIDIVDLVSEYVNLKKAGQNWKGLCPFHTEKTPSFTVSPAKQIYHCFGCGNGGDIFTFLVRYENLTFPEALRILAKKAGVTLKASQKDSLKTGEKETLYTMNKDALLFFRQNLAKNTRAAGYLKGRGIGNDIQELFSLGYALNSWNALLTYLTRKSYKPDMIKRAGLATQGSKGLYDTFRDRIMFPIYDLKGDVVAFGGRSIDGSDPKYLNSPETPVFNKRRILYGLDLSKDSIKKYGYALFMEGYLDVITAHQYGITNAVAALGTAFTQEHGKLIRRFVGDVILVFDSDEAGIKAAKNAAAILLESGLNVRVISFPEKEDPDSFLRKRGAEAFQALLEKPFSLIDFVMLQKGERRILAREAIELIAKVTDKVLQGDYVKMLAEKLKINEFFVIEELKKTGRRNRSGYKKAASDTPHRPKKKPLNEVYIIKLLLQLPKQAEEVSNRLSLDDFTDSTVRRIFTHIKDGTTELNLLLSKCEGEEEDFLTELSLTDDFENPHKALEDCVRRLKENRRKILSQELQGRIKEAEAKKDFKLLKQLQEEQQKLLSMGKK
jgi:DNA primase